MSNAMQPGQVFVEPHQEDYVAEPESQDVTADL